MDTFKYSEKRPVHASDKVTRCRLATLTSPHIRVEFLTMTHARRDPIRLRRACFQSIFSLATKSVWVSGAVHCPPTLLLHAAYMLQHATTKKPSPLVHKPINQWIVPVPANNGSSSSDSCVSIITLNKKTYFSNTTMRTEPVSVLFASDRFEGRSGSKRERRRTHSDACVSGKLKEFQVRRRLQAMQCASPKRGVVHRAQTEAPIVNPSPRMVLSRLGVR